ncbi:MAG: type I-C CRISPR-associated endonuclease Cas1c [Verrucomicrobiota bacterium]|nr:type I-C CRISPR-associated endonuclease Cas1c [Verrucomicrobiota bacterium]
MSQVLQNTLYLLTPGLSLHRDGQALRVEQERTLKLSIPIHNLESVFVFGPTIYVTPAAMRLCWENQASICYFTEWGRLEARVEGVPQGSVMLRRAQHKAADDPLRTASIARALVAGKIHNTRWLLGRSARDASNPLDASSIRLCTDELASLLRQLAKAPDDVAAIRGLEGLAAAQHFAVFTLHLRETLRSSFPMDGRNRRPPRDPINCILSFLYALIRHDCVSALTASGLDPFVGFLHADRAGRESLALDLMEEFRPLVERIAITVINRSEIKADAFIIREGGACEMTESARKLLIASYQQRKLEEIQHPLFQQKIRYGQLPFIQARLLARTIREDQEYIPHLFS